MENVRQKALAVLKRFYGYSSFYPMQIEVIECVMNRRDAVVLMPTGGGKSVCFQIPALLGEGCTIVVSPLLALMKDQVDALLANGIPAAAVNSTQSEAYNREVIDEVYAGHIKLLYISPERLLTELDTWAADMKISLIAIDEAHCISQWGHDFRPEYARLSQLKRHFPQVPVMALTATADRLTRDDIVKQLNIPNARMFVASFNRPNLSLTVMRNLSGKDKMRTLVRFIERHKGQSGIIYCLSRANVEKMALQLKQMGYNAAPFHAGMATAVKEQVQRDFLNDDITIICATIAFGMGINKSNVRWVVHSNMPRNMEGYYQEIGRAGRDGLPADTLMFYSFSDVATLMSFAKESGQATVNIEKLRRMQQYAEASVCRRRILLSYFNERLECDCGNCDVCLNPPERIDGTIICQMALSAIARVNQREGITTIIDILRGSRKAEIAARGYDRLKTYGVGRHLSFAEWNSYLLQMLQLGIIDVAYEEGNHLRITDYGRDILHSMRQVQLSKFVYEHSFGKKEKPEKTKGQGRLPVDVPVNEKLISRLKELRYAVAKKQGVPPYIVFSDRVLEVIAAERPLTKAEFATLYGVGERKTELYWEAFTAAVRKFIEANPR